VGDASATYQPLDPATLDDPFPVYARMRVSSPVFWHEEIRAWVLTRYVDCQAALRRNTIFVNDARRAGCDAKQAGSPSIQLLDGSAHLSLRRLFAGALHEVDLRRLGADVSADLRSALRAAAGPPGFDFVGDVARPVALNAITGLLGVDPPALTGFVDLTKAVEAGMDGHLAPGSAGPARQARREIDDLVRSWAARHRPDGLVARVLAGAAGSGIGRESVLSSIRVLLLAGFGATVAGTANLALALTRRPGPLPAFETEASLGRAVQEVLRHDSPTQWLTRVCAEDSRVAGQLVKRGQTVIAVLGSANRDPGQFDRPDELWLERHPNRHLGFGWGAHSCVGARVAHRIMSTILLDVSRLPGTLRPAGPHQRLLRATVRYPERLPVFIGAAHPRPTST
jgi:cytochrome P450